MAVKVLASNKKAYHNYEILETYEAGMVLKGSEVKSVRAGRISLVQGWVDMAGTGATLCEVVISRYSHQSWDGGDENRPRALLLHRKEIKVLKKKVEEKGLSVVPLKVYLKNGWVKVSVALARGKKLHDKRAVQREKDAQRKVRGALKRKQHDE